MAQVMRDGFSWGSLVAGERRYSVPSDLRWQGEHTPASAR
jgi:hypothetical protein